MVLQHTNSCLRNIGHSYDNSKKTEGDSKTTNFVELRREVTIIVYN